VNSSLKVSWSTSLSIPSNNQFTLCRWCLKETVFTAGYMLWPTTVTQKSTCHEARVMTAYEATEKWVALLTWPERQQTPLSYTTNWTL